MEREREEDKVVAWKIRGKGRGLRWHILREIVALLSRQASTTTQVQAAMLHKRGLSNPTTYSMIRELESSMAIAQEYEKDVGWFWTARMTGVSVYLDGSTKNIPAGVVQELLFSVNVNEEEE